MAKHYELVIFTAGLQDVSSRVLIFIVFSMQTEFLRALMRKEIVWLPTNYTEDIALNKIMHS